MIISCKILATSYLILHSLVAALHAAMVTVEAPVPVLYDYTIC